MSDEREPSEEAMAERLWARSDDADLAELRRVQAELDGVGGRAREEFARRAVDAGPVDHEDDVIAALLEGMEASAPAPAPRALDAAPRGDGEAWRAPGGPMLSWWWIAGAVAAVILAILAPRLFPAAVVDPGSPDDPNGILLSPDDGGFLTAPVGSVAAFGTFAWSRGPAAGGVHEVRIWFGAAPAGQPDLTAEVYDRPQWEPDTTARAELEAQDSIWWEVVAIDPVDQSEERLGSASASRSQ